MTQLQKQLIERIKQSGGVIFASPYGLYTQFGQYFAFTNSVKNPQNARNTFLNKFCVSISVAERTKIKAQHIRNLNRYRRLAIKCLEESKFEAAQRLSGRAMSLSESLDEKNYYKYYYRLKEGL
jgi:hypothetical protein